MVTVPPFWANDAVKAYEALSIVLAPLGPNTLEDVINEAVLAVWANVANDAVPNKLPVIEPLTLREPVTRWISLIILPKLTPVDVTDSSAVTAPAGITSKVPLIIWLALNVFEPVVANIVLSKPSNKLALLAKEAVATNEAVWAVTTYDAVWAVTTNDAVAALAAWEANEALVALFAKEAVPVKAPIREPVKLPVKLVALTEVRPVIVEARVKLSLDSVTKLVPAKSVNKLP